MKNNKVLLIVVLIVVALVGLPRLGINPMALVSMLGLTTRDLLMAAAGAVLMLVVKR